MKTKEEILSEREAGNDAGVYNDEEIYIAMEEYAISFGDWMREQRPDVFYGSPTTKKLLQAFEKELIEQQNKHE